MRRLHPFGTVSAVLVFVFLAGTQLEAQGTSGSVIGRVTQRDNGQPLAGARIVVPGTAVEVITNAEGAYRVPSVRTGRVQLIVYRVGFRSATDTVEVVAGQAATLDFGLEISRVQLSDVVITGTAGNQERRAQPAVVSSLDVDKLAKDSPAQSFSQLLQSRVPSVSVSSASGTVGTSRRINIRGASSVNLSNQPLIFIDGIRLIEGQPGIGVGGQASDRLNNLNPDDIESMEVIKGPAAATLYGADASAGVIQIITKRGGVGTAAFHQSLSVDVGTMDQNWTPPANYAFCTTATIAPTSTNPLCRGQTTTTLVSDNPLVRESAFRTGQIRNVAYSARGGGENYGYYMSLNRDDQEGTLPNNGFRRYSWRTNFNFLPDPRLTVNASVGLHQSDLDAPVNDNNIYGYLGGGLLGSPLSRHDLGTGANGFFGVERDVAAITAVQNEVVTRGTTAGLTLEYLPMSWFTNRLTVGGDLQRDEQTQFFPKNTRGSYTGLLNTGSNFQQRRGIERYTVDYQGNVRHTFGDADQWELNNSGGVQFISTRSEFVTVTGTGFVTNSNNVPTSASQTSGTGERTDVRQRGYVAQSEIAHLKRRYLQVGVRIDEFSVFGEDVKPAVLPKVGVSWVISEEPFFGVSDVIRELRLRAAWGQTGRAPAAGAALQTLSAEPSTVGTTVQPGATLGNPGNAQLKPERGRELEVGFEASLLNDRLGFEVNYFNKTTTDLILTQPLPPSLGFANNPSVNIGEVKNSGFEVSVSATALQRDNFTWDILGGFSTLKNELTDLGDIAPFGTLNRFTPGYQLGAFVSKRIRNINEATGVVTVSDTLEVVGNIFPTFEGSVTSTMRFFNQLRLSAQVDTKQDFLVYNNTDFFRETQLVRSNRRLDTLVLSRRERLRKYGNPSTTQPAFVQENGLATTVGEVRDGFLQPGDFVRFRELGLTWDIPNRWLGTVGAVNSASIGVAIQNLKLWKHKDFDGPDPEVISSATLQFVRDDFLTLPNPRTTVFRLNVTF